MPITEATEAQIRIIVDQEFDNEVYVHTQTIPATPWIISHNLGRFPQVSVAVFRTEEESGITSLVTAIVSVVHVDINTVHIVPTNAETGKAYLI